MNKALWLILGFMVSVGCSDATPEFEDLSAALGGPSFTDSEGNSISSISIFSANDSLLIMGVCSHLYDSLEWQPEGADSFSKISSHGSVTVAGSDLSCDDGRFSILISDVSAVLGSMQIGDLRTISLRGETKVKNSNSSTISVTYVDPSLPSPDPINLVMLDSGTDYLQLDWDSAGGSTMGFRVSYTTGSVPPANCSSGNTIPESSISGTQINVSALSEDTDYALRVCSINGTPIESTGVTLLASTLLDDDPPIAVDLTGIAYNEDTAFTLYLDYPSTYTDPEGHKAESCNIANTPVDWVVTCGNCDPAGLGTCELNVTPKADFNGVFSFDYTVTANGLTSVSKLISGEIKSVPEVLNVTSTDSNGTYKIGDQIKIDIHFDETISVDNSSGGPFLSLESGTPDINLTSSNVSGSVLTFNYTVNTGNESPDLDYLSSSALFLPAGSSITSVSSGNHAILNLPAPGTVGSLSVNKDFIIDGVVPTVSIENPAAATKINMANETSFNVNGTCSEPGQNVSFSGNASAVSAVCQANNTWSAVVDFSGAPEGTVNLIVTHLDVAGNPSTDILNYDKDTIPPVVTINTTAEITASNKSSYTVTGTCETTPIGSVSLSGNFAGGTKIATCSSNVWSTNLDYKDVSDGIGVATLTASQVDGHANQGSDSVTIDKDTTVVLSLSTVVGGGLEAAINNQDLLLTVNITPPSDTAINIDLNASGTATQGSDFSNFTAGTITLPVNSSGHTFSALRYTDDQVVEPHETVILDLSNPSGAYVSASMDPAKDQFVATITNDDFPPVVTSFPSPTAGTYLSGHKIAFDITYDKVMIVTGTPKLALTVDGATGSYAYYTSTTAGTLTFEYIVQREAVDTNGIIVASSVSLNGGTIKDTYGNDAILTFTPPTTSGVLTALNPVPTFELPTCINKAEVGNLYECDIPTGVGDIGNTEDSSPGPGNDDTETWHMISSTCNWLSLNTGTKKFSGTPVAGDEGNCYLSYALRDGPSPNTEFAQSETHKIYIRVEGNRTGQIADVSAGWEHACAIVNDGVRCWGGNTSGELGRDFVSAKEDTAQDVFGLGAGNGSLFPSRLALGEQFSCALVAGAVKCWGSDDHGKLGDGGGTSNSPSPTDVSIAGGPIVDIAAGSDHACLIQRNTVDLKNDGTVWCWGEGANGKLGNGVISNQHSPVQVLRDDNSLPLVGITDLAVGRHHTCALAKDGTVYCWGGNDFEQLGQEMLLTISTKARQVFGIGIGTNKKAIAVNAGGTHTCALLEGGNGKCWGRNSAGQLGIGSTINKGNNPGDMGNGSGLTNLINFGNSRTSIAIVTGTAGNGDNSGGHNCTLLDNGKVKCWGRNSVGQLGIDSEFNKGNNSYETDFDSLLPTNFGSGSVVDMALGGFFSCLLAEGSPREIRCWGQNSSYQLGKGDGSTSDIGDYSIFGGSEMGSNLIPVVGLGF